MFTRPGRPSTTIDSTSSARGWSVAARWPNIYLTQRIAGRVVGYGVLILLTLSSIFPLIWMVITSLRERYDVFGGPLIPKHVNLDAYRFILTDFHIITFFRNSLVITSTTVLAVVSLATLAGYAFAHLDFWGKEIIFLVLLGTLMVPPTVLILPLFLQLRDLGLVNTQRGLALAYISSGIAFSVFLMRSFFKTLPTELIDAGRVDGASELGIFLRIMLPLARPGIATVLIFQFMGTWNEFLYAATIVQTPKMRNLQPAIFSMVGRYSTNWPALTAALTLSILPIIIVYVFMQRQFVAGLTAGAVRG
jgi:ABC-type glycerol-3-phosphate transport system permease component